jgi:hypothetical protein
MKLPNAEHAIVPASKITLYLLSTSHKDGRHKAVFFQRFGFRLEAPDVLTSALLRHACDYEVAEAVATPFGQNYVVEGPLSAPDGRTPHVRVGWFIAKGEEIATLATAYPLD